jgi:EsV-1-7 cysteine-rich motif
MNCFCGKIKYPIFNYKNLSAKYCIDCKLPDMIDVKNRTCNICGIRANFKFDGLYYCNTHKPPGAYNIHVKMCVICKNVQAYFNFDTERKAKYCNSCRLPNMINVKKKI